MQAEFIANLFKTLVRKKSTPDSSSVGEQRIPPEDSEGVRAAALREVTTTEVTSILSPGVSTGESCMCDQPGLRNAALYK